MLLAAVWFGIVAAALGHGFFWMDLVNRLHGLDADRRLVKRITLVILVVFAAIPVLVARHAGAPPLPQFNPFAGNHWTAWYVRVAAALGVLGVLRALWFERNRNDRSVLVEWTSETSDVSKQSPPPRLHGAMARGCGLIPANEALRLSIDRKRLALPRLPRELTGLTVAHISDLHMTGHVGIEFFQHAIAAMNRLRPDMIAVTGDVVEAEKCWPWLATTLGELCAPLGVHYILGNHDDLVDPERTRALLDGAGLTYCGGRWLRAEWNGVPVLIGGNELPWIKPAASLAALPPRGAGGGEFRLALCHSPDQFAWCCRADVDLALAGHTHGGQVQLPLLGPIAAPSLHSARYASGVFRRGDTVLHVTRGLSSENPWRWRCTPEIALLELTRGAK